MKLLIFIISVGTAVTVLFGWVTPGAHCSWSKVVKLETKPSIGFKMAVSNCENSVLMKTLAQHVL